MTDKKYVADMGFFLIGWLEDFVTWRDEDYACDHIICNIAECYDAYYRICYVGSL